MPTASEASFTEARSWTELARRWRRDNVSPIWEDRPPTERAVVVFFDPVEDLARRSAQWGHELADGSLPSLALFAASLATVEADSWGSGDGDVATRAYETRRFLLGDRLLHWAVPWLDAVGRCYPQVREPAHEDRDFLLRLADDMRLEPLLPAREGLVVEGEDSLGSLEMVGSLDQWVSSLWSGHLMLDATWAGLGSERGRPVAEELALLYEVVAHRWLGVARRHPGSAQIWTDLAARARRTSKLLGVPPQVSTPSARRPGRG